MPSVRLVASDLAWLLRVALPFVSDDDTRPILQAARLVYKGGQVGVEATDTYTLVRAWQRALPLQPDDPLPEDTGEVIVDGCLLDRLDDLLDLDPDAIVTIWLDDGKQLRVSHEDWTWVLLPVDADAGTWPHTKRIWEEAIDGGADDTNRIPAIGINPRLLARLQRVPAPGRDTFDGFVQLRFGPDMLKPVYVTWPKGMQVEALIMPCRIDTD